MRRKAIRSTVLTAEEAMVVAFRRHTLLPLLDDCLYALQPGDPAPDPLVIALLPAPSWHQPPADTGGEAVEKKRFEAYPIGCFQVDIAEVRTEEGRPRLYVGIGRMSKFAFARLHNKAERPPPWGSSRR